MTTENEITELRKILSDRRESLRQLYARFRDLASKAIGKFGAHGPLRFVKEKHLFEARWESGMSRYKAYEAARKIVQLQSNIQTQAMLLLELEHAIDREERKMKESLIGAN